MRQRVRSCRATSAQLPASRATRPGPTWLATQSHTHRRGWRQSRQTRDFSFRCRAARFAAATRFAPTPTLPRRRGNFAIGRQGGIDFRSGRGFLATGGGAAARRPRGNALSGLLVLLVADLVHQILPSHIIGRAELLPPLGDGLADFAYICAQAHEVERRAEASLLYQ